MSKYFVSLFRLGEKRALFDKKHVLPKVKENGVQAAMSGAWSGEAGPHSLSIEQ